MQIVKFNQVDEFCEELEREQNNIDRGIVRVTNSWQQSKLSSNISHVSVIATCSIKGQIVRLDRYCGDHWGLKSETDEKTMQKAEQAQEEIKVCCVRLNLDMRAGVLEESTGTVV